MAIASSHHCEDKNNYIGKKAVYNLSSSASHRMLMLATCRINKDWRTRLKAETAGRQAGCARVPDLTLGLTFLRSHCNAVSATHQDPTLGQLAVAFLAFKATLRPATLLCAVCLGVCLQCCFFVAFCISTHRLSSLLQFAIAFSHCRLDHCTSGSGVFGWAASPPLVIWKIR